MNGSECNRKPPRSMSKVEVWTTAEEKRGEREEERKEKARRERSGGKHAVGNKEGKPPIGQKDISSGSPPKNSRFLRESLSDFSPASHLPRLSRRYPSKPSVTQSFCISPYSRSPEPPFPHVSPVRLSLFMEDILRKSPFTLSGSISPLAAIERKRDRRREILEARQDSLHYSSLNRYFSALFQRERLERRQEIVRLKLKERSEAHNFLFRHKKQ